MKERKAIRVKNKEERVKKLEELTSSSVNFYCGFYMEDKKKNCKMMKSKDQPYCPVHLPKDSLIAANRIACPYDPQHTVEVSKLRSHLVKCNARPPEASFYRPYLHVDNFKEETKVTEDETNLRKLSNEHYAEILKKIRENKKRLSDLYKVQDSLKEDKRLKEYYEEKRNSKNEKHLLQESSLIANLEDFNLSQNVGCFVEFGAGKAGLSRSLSVALEKDSNKNYCFLLVDRSNMRGKFDGSISKQGIVDRIKVDIRDLDLSQVNTLKGKSVVGISKHLCGGGTDVALRCIKHFIENIGNTDGGNFRGILIALCCHHQCTWESYIEKEYFKELGFSEIDFVLISKMSAWATCGKRGQKEEVEISRKKRKLEKESESFVEEDEENNEHETNYNDVDNEDAFEHPSGLTFEEREQIGFDCKFLLNIGRVKYMEKLGFVCSLIKYTNLSVEDIALVCYLPPQEIKA